MDRVVLVDQAAQVDLLVQSADLKDQVALKVRLLLYPVLGVLAVLVELVVLVALAVQAVLIVLLPELKVPVAQVDQAVLKTI